MGLTIPDRLPDWRVRLTAYTRSVNATTFRPGKHDCALFCAGAVQAMTGFDAARGWRGYRTLNEGKKRLEKAGYSQWWDMIADRECLPKKVRLGDLALVACGDELAGGLCLGSSVYVLGFDGAGLVRHSKIIRGFKI